MTRKIDVYPGLGTAISVSRTETDGLVQWKVEYTPCYVDRDGCDMVVGRSAGGADLAIGTVLAYLDGDIADLEDWVAKLKETRRRLLVLQERSKGKIEGRWKDEFKRIFDKEE